MTVDDHGRDVGTVDDLIDRDEVRVGMSGRRVAEVELNGGDDDEINPRVERGCHRIRLIDGEH